MAGSARSERRHRERGLHTCEPPLAPRLVVEGLRRRFTAVATTGKKGGEKKRTGEARKVRFPPRLLPPAWPASSGRASLQSDDEDRQRTRGRRCAHRRTHEVHKLKKRTSPARTCPLRRSGGGGPHSSDGEQVGRLAGLASGWACEAERRAVDDGDGGLVGGARAVGAGRTVVRRNG